MKTKAVSLFLVLASFNVWAEIQPERVSALLAQSERYRYDGANCFASVAFTSGLIDDAAYLSSTFFEAITRTPYCQQVGPAGKLNRGDFIVIGDSKHDDVGRWIHTVLAVGDGKGFAKMGFKKDDKTLVTDLEENIHWYLKQDPTMKTLHFRCDFQALRSGLEQSDLAVSWKELLRIRKQLFSELTTELSSHEGLLESLNAIEAEISRSKSSNKLKEVIKGLVVSTRDQLQLTDAFIVEM